MEKVENNWLLSSHCSSELFSLLNILLYIPTCNLPPLLSPLNSYPLSLFLSLSLCASKLCCFLYYHYVMTAVHPPPNLMGLIMFLKENFILTSIIISLHLTELRYLLWNRTYELQVVNKETIALSMVKVNLLSKI